MITMMYLVYTAMLALNVSAEVVEGFRSVGSAMTNSNINLQDKLDDTYANFDAALQNSREKVQASYDKAQQVRSLSNELKLYIDSLECEFIGMVSMDEAKIHTDPNNPDQVTIVKLKDAQGKTIIDSVRRALQIGGFAWMEKGLDDTHGAPRFFLDGSSEKGTGQAYTIHQKISEYVSAVKEILGEDSSLVKFPFDVDKMFLNKEGKTVTWEMKNFDEVVAGAGLVTLTRLKAETMNAEFDAVNMLYKQVSKGDMKFSDIALISRPTSTYILVGGTYETRINVAAYDAKQKFTATIGGQTLTANDSGAVVYRRTCMTPGKQSIEAIAKVQTPDGEAKEIRVRDEFFVAEPLGSIQLEKMMVVYNGLENPITVSAAGVDARKIVANIDGGGSLTPGAKPGEYILRPNGSKKEINISLSAQLEKGKKPMDLGVKKVRCKNIPQPIIKVGGYENGATISKKAFTDGMKVLPYRPQGFDFEIPKGSMKVRKLEVFVSNNPQPPSDGNTLNSSVISAIRKASKGDMVAITATVLMPDGKEQLSYWMVKLK